MAVRVASTNRAPSASRGGPHRKTIHTPPPAPRSRTPQKQIAAQRRAVQPIVPHDRGAAGIAAHRWHGAMQHECSGHSWSRCSRSSAAPTSRPAVPAPALRSTSAACAHGAPSRAPTQRSTPDAGANARSQRAVVVPVRMRHELAPHSHAPRWPHLPGRGGSQGVLTSALGVTDKDYSGLPLLLTAHPLRT